MFQSYCVRVFAKCHLSNCVNFRGHEVTSRMRMKMSKRLWMIWHFAALANFVGLFIDSVALQSCVCVLSLYSLVPELCFPRSFKGKFCVFFFAISNYCWADRATNDFTSIVLVHVAHNCQYSHLSINFVAFWSEFRMAATSVFDASALKYYSNFIRRPIFNVLLTRHWFNFLLNALDYSLLFVTLNWSDFQTYYGISQKA